jgi:hypothetical protein
MTTYVIGLVVVALVYGLFWNNGSARSYPHGAVLPGRGNDRRGGDTAPHLETESYSDRSPVD